MRKLVVRISQIEDFLFLDEDDSEEEDEDNNDDDDDDEGPEGIRRLEEARDTEEKRFKLGCVAGRATSV